MRERIDMIAIMSDLDFFGELKRACAPERVRVIELQSGEALFRQGDDPPGLSILVDGRVNLIRWTEVGGAVRIHAARRGETIAEASLYADVCHCEAVAATRSVIHLLPRRLVLRVFDDAPTLAQAFAVHLANALMKSRRLLELRAIMPLTERVRARLEELVDARGELPKGTPLNSIAADLDVTPAALYRAVAALETAGALTRPARGRIQLLGIRARHDAQASA